MTKTQFERIEDSADEIRDTIEKDLARMRLESPNISEEELKAWKEQFGGKLDEVLEKRPDMLSLYATKPAEALEEIGKELDAE